MPVAPDAALARCQPRSPRYVGVHIRTKMFEWEEGQIAQVSLDAFFACLDARGGNRTAVFLASPSAAARRKTHADHSPQTTRSILACFIRYFRC